MPAIETVNDPIVPILTTRMDLGLLKCQEPGERLAGLSFLFPKTCWGWVKNGPIVRERAERANLERSKDSNIIIVI